MVEFEDNGRQFACEFEADGRLAVTADHQQTARGYLIGNLVRFPKSLAIGDECVMTLEIPEAGVKQLKA